MDQETYQQKLDRIFRAVKPLHTLTPKGKTMDHETYQRLEEVKANIEALLEQAGKTIEEEAKHLFDDDSWYDKFIWRFDTNITTGYALHFILEPKNKTEFGLWRRARQHGVHALDSSFRIAIEGLGLTWISIDASICLQWQLDSPSSSTFSTMVKEEKIVIKNTDHLLKMVASKIKAIKEKAKKQIDSLSGLDDAIMAVIPF